MEKYEAPKAEFVEVKKVDVIIASGCNGEEGFSGEDA